MRRIFGASSITGSSTSNSLASDALPSPSSTTASHEYPSSHGQDAPSANDLSSKSWFGLARSASHSSVASRGSASSPGPGAQPPPHLAAGSSRLAESFNLEVEDDFDFGQLPFGQARSPPPPLSPPGTGRKRDSARSSVGGGFGAGRSRPFSPEATVPAETVSQDALMIELLSGAAVVEARDFEILAWEETQEAKKAREHALLSTRIASLTRSVALETRLRDSAAKLVRLSAPASEASTPSNPGSPARPRVTREQAEAQLATAQAKLEALQADLYKVGSREAELRTKLLRHTAAVLAASLRQKEQEDEGLSTPAAAHTLSPALGSPAAASHLRATPSSTGSNRFDGAHFFAGNREAIVPRARTISANGTVGSPYASPQLGASGSFGVNAVQLEHEVAERDARIKELEAQASSLERRLVEVQQQAEADVRAVREALDRKEPEAREEQERTRRELSSAQADVKGLREELHAARDDVEHARRQHEVLRREADEARREAEEHRSRLSLSRSSPSADDAQGEVDAASKLRDQALELAETQHKLEEAEERVVELEEELQRTEEEMKDERRSWEDKVREAEAAGSAASAPLASRVGEVDDDERVEESRRRIEQLEGERQSVVQAISDVLRRHRTRPTLGAALREAPSLDDDLEGRQDLPAYLASTLDAHFDRASSHVEGLGSDLSALHEQRDLRAGIEDEVAQAHERVQALEADVESLQAERDSLETELDLLRSQTHDHEARLSMVPQLEADLKTARDAATQAQRELAGAQSRLAELDALVATQDKQLQDLWRTIPPLEGRTRANSELNDLSSLRTAFEASSPQQPARKPIGALLKNAIGAGGSSSEAGDAVSASGDYSVEALVARVELLLAEDQKLVQKLVALEGEQGAKGDAQDKKIAELEERLEVSGNQEVTMLERLNDLTESLEQTRAEKRKLEADQAQLHEQLAVAQRSPTPAPAAPTDESEMQELRDQIADLEEELADAQRREQKTRAQLLDELSGVQSELTQTRTKLRQAERKLGSK